MDKARAPQKPTEIAEQTLQRILALGITPHPRNYAVWYGYFSGDPELVRAVDAILNGGQGFDDSHGAELYREHFSYDNEGAAIRETSERVEVALGQVVSMLSDAGQDTSRYGDALAGITGDLSDGDSIEEVRAIVTRLSEHTRTMTEQNKRFEEEISRSNQEIEQLRQNLEDSRLEAKTDSLTGLNNRKYFDESLFAAARDAADVGTPLSLLMLDIDHFKRFNDTYGHNLGDVVLKQVARCIGACVKGKDLTARFGGEEFVILLPETAVEDAMTVAQQVCRTVAGKEIVMRSSGKSLGKITLSAGAAQLRPPESAEQLLQRADEAMYLAKNGGRNRAVSEYELENRLSATA